MVDEAAPRLWSQLEASAWQSFMLSSDFLFLVPPWWKFHQVASTHDAGSMQQNFSYV
jgi:hypothetical protein